MALTHTRALELAELLGAQATEFLDLYGRMQGLLAHNSALSIDWANASKPAFLNEDAAGNLDGLDFTRAQVANALGTFAAVQELLDNGHRGNLELIARARR